MLYQGIIGGGSSPVEPEDLSPVLLWTNPSPENAFTAQTVNLDLTDYAGVLIESTTDGIGSRNYIKKTETGACGTLGSETGGGVARAATLSGNNVVFGDAYALNTVTNTAAKPIKIYGIKEYVVEPFKPIDATVCERAYTFPSTSGATNTWTVDKDGLYLVGGEAPGLEDSRGSITFIGEATLISGNDAIRVFTAKTGAQVQLRAASGNTFTPYINIIK